MRILPSLAVAAVASALAVFINYATSPGSTWWVWIGVGILTVMTAGLSAVRAPKSDQGSGTATNNQITGAVGGSVVQARDVQGGIQIGRGYTPVQDKDRRET